MLGSENDCPEHCSKMQGWIGAQKHGKLRVLQVHCSCICVMHLRKPEKRGRGGADWGHHRGPYEWEHVVSVDCAVLKFLMSMRHVMCRPEQARGAQDGFYFGFPILQRAPPPAIPRMNERQSQQQQTQMPSTQPLYKVLPPLPWRRSLRPNLCAFESEPVKPQWSGGH